MDNTSKSSEGLRHWKKLCFLLKAYSWHISPFKQVQVATNTKHVIIVMLVKEH